MTKSSKNPRVDAFLSEAKTWQTELAKLRKILLACELVEEFKWGKPCYMFQSANVVVVLPLKNHCALLFSKGALLKDTHQLLIKAGENTQAARQMRFTSAREVDERTAVLTDYLHQAIEVERAGLEVTYKTISEFKIPDELREKFAAAPALKKAFSALTPGRQRGYLIHFSAPKQTETRAARIEKCTPRILAAKGLNDR